MQRHSALRLAILAALSLSLPAYAQAGNEQTVEELRNTLVSVMEALVQKGVLTREQAQQIVANAQAKTEATAKEKAAQEATEKDAVRVTYVPDNIKTEISNQVAAQLKPSVVNEVVAQAKSEKWGVPGALPDWVSNLNLYGDVRMRAEQASYGADNGMVNGQFRQATNYDAINSAGGVGKAGRAQYLNTTEDRFRTLVRARLGLLADLGGSFKADLRLSSGTGRTVNSTNQTLGAYNARGTILLDKAALIWDHISQSANSEFELRAGRFANPYNVVSELVWDNDLTFEGVSATYAMDLFGRQVNKMERGLYVTIGAMPLREVELSNKDKWLYGAQLGTELPFADSSIFKLSGAYYQFQNIAGVRNEPNDDSLDYTAPLFLSKGNTLFDIRNTVPIDNSVNLYALAADYKLVNANFSLDFPVAKKRVVLAAEYVRNIGYDRAKVLARTGKDYEGKVNGYDVSLSVGDAALKALGNWRAMFGYRYLERDAVLDAFTDSDFHLGGTDTKGYQFSYEIGLSKNTSLKARLMSATEIDGTAMDPSVPLAIDVYHLDFNGSF